MSRRRSTSPPPPASLPDDDDMLGEILLRLPPQPSSLPRASLVSKRWCSLVADPQFHRRFCDHHGKPLLLGFFFEDYYPSYPFVPILDRPDRIPRSRLSMPLDEDNRIVDCRHGLVLSLSQSPPRRLLVLDPVSREQRRLIVPPELDNDQMFIFSGAVLRPARIQGSHFQVALLAHDTEHTRVFACLYSSETGIWSKINSAQLQTFISNFIIRPGPSTLIGNSLCWLLMLQLDHRYVILEFDLDRQSLTVTELPPQIKAPPSKLRIVPTEDGGLGFIHLSEFHGQLWKREPDSVWVPDRAIEFEELRSACKGYPYPQVVGFSEDINALLVQMNSGVFLVYLRSMEFKKISNMGGTYLHYPFASFYPAGTGIGDGHGGDDVLEDVKWLFVETC